MVQNQGDKDGYFNEPIAQELPLGLKEQQQKKVDKKSKSKKDSFVSSTSKTCHVRTSKLSESRNVSITPKPKTEQGAKTVATKSGAQGRAKMCVLSYKPCHRPNISSVMSGLSDCELGDPNPLDDEHKEDTDQPPSNDLKSADMNRTSVICQETAKIHGV